MQWFDAQRTLSQMWRGRHLTQQQTLSQHVLGVLQVEEKHVRRTTRKGPFCLAEVRLGKPFWTGPGQLCHFRSNRPMPNPACSPLQIDPGLEGFRLLKQLLERLWSPWDPQSPKTHKKRKWHRKKKVSTQHHRNVVLRLPRISFDKGCFGQFKGCLICLGNVDTQLEGALLPRVDVATRSFTVVLKQLRIQEALTGCVLWGNSALPTPCGVLAL